MSVNEHYFSSIHRILSHGFLKRVALSHGGEYAFYWLNGFDTDNSGTFTWIGSQTPASYTNWRNDEPNDYFGHEICIALNPGFLEGWHDVLCSWTGPVVCERDS